MHLIQVRSYLFLQREFVKFFQEKIFLAHFQRTVYSIFNHFLQSQSFLTVVSAPNHHERLQCLKIFFIICFGNAFCHGVIEIRNTLSAMHIILVGLNRDTGKRGIGQNRLWFPDISMAGGESVPK